VLFLLEKVSADWWEGTTANNQKGLIADKYIIVRHRYDTIQETIRDALFTVVL